MSRKILLWGISFALLSVILGAFGAHALKSIVPLEKLQIFETGVRYQFMHAMALIFLSLYIEQKQGFVDDENALNWASRFFCIGIFLFSGSLYGLTISAFLNPSWTTFLGPITPLGGLCFMLGWLSWGRVVFLHKVDK
jgi:uncharacterized membrane protein YgdD (TMEM256/DUF423 family)